MNVVMVHIAVSRYVITHMDLITVSVLMALNSQMTMQHAEVRLTVICVYEILMII